MLYYSVVVLIGAVFSAAAGMAELAANATKSAGWLFGLFALLMMASLALGWLASISPAI